MQIKNHSLSWVEAYRKCHDLNADLLYPNDNTENSWFIKLLDGKIVN